ncbi:MAG: insulinase family protein [Planctomycetes bacterium]|nr:insulinase family protein [Planctomycetota bacterium]
MRSQALSLATLLLAAATLGAQTNQGMLPFPYTIDDLGNGLRLITMRTSFPRVASVYITVATGSRNEVEPGKSGFAHFFEHMMFRGTKTRAAGEQAAAFKRIGAARNAYTTDDFTCYHTTFASEDLETVLELEADRFRNLEYSQRDFRTEALAVLGEYNKNSSDPLEKLMEVVQDAAFDVHTYKHTTMGFLRDIREMPRQYEYSRLFFERWYRPDNTTLLVVGDVTRERVLPLVEKHWGEWAGKTAPLAIPAEPPQKGVREVHHRWPTPTQPWVLLAFKGPAVRPLGKEMPALDVLSALTFAPSSELFQKLYVREQKVDVLFASFPDHVDPYLLIVAARLKDPADAAYVRDELLKACDGVKSAAIDGKRLADVKSNQRYGFARSLSSSEAIAATLAGYVARFRTPEVVNQVYEHYAQVGAEEVRAVARRYFVEDGLTLATLSHEPLPGMDRRHKLGDGGAAAGPSASAQGTTQGLLLQPSESPLVALRLVYPLGAMEDPPGKEGLAHVTAALLAGGATRKRSYEQILAALHPMAADIAVQVDKECTVFATILHRDNLQAGYGILKEMLTEPAFDARDLERVKADTIAFLDTQLRRANDEELGKEVLYGEIYAGHPYRHHSAGTLTGVRSITVEDVQAQWRKLTQRPMPRPTMGIAGGFPQGFPAQVQGDLLRIPDFDVEEAQGQVLAPSPVPKPPAPTANRVTIVQKETLATGIHLGFPIDVRRGHPDWVALWLVRSWLGEHRSENSHLYQRLREVRGLNYGDYAYIEYFPRGMYQFTPDPNLARSSQIFQIWIRPVPHERAHFALRAAWYELDKLVRDGLGEAHFAATRAFLAKNVNLLVQTQDHRLGYALDSAYYGIGDFVEYVQEGLKKLTLADVNRVIRTHLRSDRLQIVIVTQDAEGLRQRLLDNTPSPIVYQAAPPQEVLDEDKVIQDLRIPLAPDAVRIVPIGEVFLR